MYWRLEYSAHFGLIAIVFGLVGLHLYQKIEA
jgi:hypothetical protein